MAIGKEFADYCCDLLAGIGPCVAKRMFGGWGLSVDGMSIAWLIDLGQGERLWLKASPETAAQFRAAGCEQFIYEARGRQVSVNHFAPPEEAMESAPLMLPWARLALQAALEAQAIKAAKANRATKTTRVVKTAQAKPPTQPSKTQKSAAAKKATPLAAAKTPRKTQKSAPQSGALKAKTVRAKPKK